MASLTEDLEVLEKSIRLLKIEWEKFFAGIEKKPPVDLRTRVENLLRQYASTEIRNNTERFRYMGLSARYSTFNELWNKRLRALEEGRPVGFHGRFAEAVIAATPPRVHLPEGLAPSRAGEFRVGVPDQDAAAMQGLFNRFIEARKQAGENGAVKFESFQKLIAQQASQILSDKGARAVDFRIETKDGKVSLKAKPVR